MNANAAKLLPCLPVLRLAAGAMLALLLCACASTPTPEKAHWHVEAQFVPPTNALQPARNGAPTYRVTWPASESGTTYPFPSAIAVECTGPETCRQAAVKSHASVRTTPAGRGRFRLQGTLVATVGRVSDRIDLLSEGVFTTPFDQTVAVGEPVTVPGFRGTSVTLRVHPDPVAAINTQ